ncbi:MAG: amidase [Hyphomicrobiales bacterium]|nr:amidase [Hyphomicrobiales bacterium]
MKPPSSYLAASAQFGAGSSPSDFLERCLAAIEARESDVKAFVVRLDPALARERAAASTRRWRAGAPLSPIDGMPIGVKDVIETIDMPTGMGSPLYDGYRGEKDSASVKALRDAGAIIIGKTVTTEFAASWPGPTRNPHDLARTPGGSSSGSAAGVAAGFFPAGLGTQVVGSIVRPASFCGVYGVKPSVGAINRLGSHDYMSQSAQGVLAASLADAWQVLIEIANRCGGDPGFPGLAGPAALPPARTPRTLAVLETPGWKIASAGARTAFGEKAARLRDAGVTLLTRATSPQVEALEAMLPRAMPLTRYINGWESVWPLRTYGERDASKLSPPMRERLAECDGMNVGEYRAALAERAAIRAAFASLSTLADACLTLAAPGPAPVGLASTGDPNFAVPGSFLGAPAMSLPLMSDEGLPLGLQLLGFEGADADLFAVAGGVQALAR